MSEEIQRLRFLLRFVADHITQRDGFDKPDPVFLRSMIEAGLAKGVSAEDRWGSPPEPVSNPSQAWCDAYARWYYGDKA